MQCYWYWRLYILMHLAKVSKLKNNHNRHRTLSLSTCLSNPSNQNVRNATCSFPVCWTSTVNITTTSIEWKNLGEVKNLNYNYLSVEYMINSGLIPTLGWCRQPADKLSPWYCTCRAWRRRCRRARPWRGFALRGSGWRRRILQGYNSIANYFGFTLEISSQDF